VVEGRTHRPVITHRCHSCDACVGGCPAELFSEYRDEKESLRGILYGNRMLRKGDSKGITIPPCQDACPIGQDARGYVALIAREKFREALELIREVNPLPAICGFVCHHPCEQACLRQQVDAPVPIMLLKRFVAEQELKQGRAARWPARKRKERVLIVGSGPAGLAAANDLALLGYRVTLFEALSVLGGMLTVGIPAFRLPRNILREEIEGIRALGVVMQTGRQFPIRDGSKMLRKLGFQAAFLAPGAHRSARLGIPGESLQRVYPGVEFLRAANLGNAPELGKKVTVIGGGNVAIDAARFALRLGTQRVEILYRRSREEMPAIPGEVDAAISEGVTFHFLAAPASVIGSDTVTGIECIRMKLGQPDATGRRTPLPVIGSSFEIKADSIIIAAGQNVDKQELEGFALRRDGTLQIDPATGETSVKGFFAGGDVVTGPGYAIDAIAMGKRAAAAIGRYLS
jgi:heterodisulfide reductase subunit A